MYKKAVDWKPSKNIKKELQMDKHWKSHSKGIEAMYDGL